MNFHYKNICLISVMHDMHVHLFPVTTHSVMLQIRPPQSLHSYTIIVQPGYILNICSEVI